VRQQQELGCFMRRDPIAHTTFAVECSTTGSRRGGQSWVLITSVTNSPRHGKVMSQVQPRSPVQCNRKGPETGLEERAKI